MIIHTHVKKSKQKRVPKRIREENLAWSSRIAGMSFSNGKKSQISQKNVKNYVPDASYPPFRTQNHIPSAIHTTVVTGPLTKSGIMKDFYKLSQEDRERVENIANSVAPLHKSNYVYISEGMNPSGFGRKNEVL